MKLTNVRKKHICAVMMGLVALMLVDSIYQFGTHVRWRIWLPETLASESAATQPADTQPADTQPADTQPADTQPADGSKKSGSAKPAAIHPVIAKRNIMTKVKPKGHGMQLTGVLGTTALFKTRKGDTVAIDLGKSGHGIKVTAIDGYVVTIEHKDKTETMNLFKATKSGPPRAPSVQASKKDDQTKLKDEKRESGVGQEQDGSSRDIPQSPTDDSGSTKPSISGATIDGGDRRIEITTNEDGTRSIRIIAE